MTRSWQIHEFQSLDASLVTAISNDSDDVETARDTLRTLALASSLHVTSEENELERVDSIHSNAVSVAIRTRSYLQLIHASVDHFRRRKSTRRLVFPSPWIGYIGIFIRIR